jgi:hypothetical protein
MRPDHISPQSRLTALAAQCRCKAESEGLASYMNDTKWRELCYVFSSFETKPRWRARDLLTGFLSEWDHDWFHHVGPDYCSIEWLEIDSTGCDRESVRAVLRGVGAPYEGSEPFFRVIGYKQ